MLDCRTFSRKSALLCSAEAAEDECCCGVLGAVANMTLAVAVDARLEDAGEEEEAAIEDGVALAARLIA